ncbi:MAG TPA: LysR family transcriptional regulator [Candidatus Faecivicinus avistercoris]|nr:LysR family transcriptional regulator [Candidatus Faecivicinus avistercoris]
MVDVKLNTLLKVYEMGSYTRAAEKLSLTQPAVSKHIRQLERELGVSIFDRTGPKLRLTPEGKLIVRYAERVIALSDGLRRALADRNRAVDRLRVGVTHTSESSIVAEVLARYTEENVNTRITLRTDALASLYEMLKSYQIDIAIVEGDVSDPAIRTIRLDTDDLAVAVSNEHPLASRPSVTIDELRRERLILRLPSSGTRTLFDANLESRGMSPDDFNVILEVDNIATIKDLVRRNYGVSVLARSACMDELRKGKIRMLPIEDLTMVRQINLLYHHTFEHAEVLQDIVRIYNAATREGSVG